MALIKCPECGKEVSDKASACIHCGFPIVQTQNEISSIGKITITVDKHPNEGKNVNVGFGVPVYGASQKIYIMTDYGCISEGTTGFDLSFTVTKQTMIYASWTNKINKDGLFGINKKTNSESIIINPNRNYHFHIKFIYGALVKIVLVEE